MKNSNFIGIQTRIIVTLLLLIAGINHSAYAYELSKVSFSLEIDGISINLNRFYTTILPGETLQFKVNSKLNNNFNVKSSEGELVELGENSWQFTPTDEQDQFLLTIVDVVLQEKIELVVFVLVPATKQEGEYLNGYRIGNYPDKLYKDNPAYKKPNGFIEVTESNKDTYLTPHFQLKQFLCKQLPNSKHKYLVIQPKLLVKLELLLEKINETIQAANTLFVMSGYRTPYYNASIGNGKYSRHIFGDAADVYVDVNYDGVIDDLNKDSKASMEDASKMYQLIENIENEPYNQWLIGGLGKYKKTPSHTWNIHVDTRGFKARW